MNARAQATLGTLALVLVTGTAAQAAEPYAGLPGAGPPSFSDLDLDRNGVLTKTEAEERQGLVEDWTRVDRNLDSLIERSEFAAFEVEEAARGPALPQSQPELTPMPRPEPLTPVDPSDAGTGTQR
jgi:hypothetical protein